jgi:hypothetical protein
MGLSVFRKRRARSSGRRLTGVVLLVLALPLFSSPALGEIIIINSSVSDNVYGNGDQPAGFPLNPTLSPSGNTVTIDPGGTVTGAVYGGYANVPSGSVTVTNNKVIISSGGTVTGAVYGGYAADASMEDSDSATVTGNTVRISGGTVNGSVYGGWLDTGGSGIAEANGNTVATGNTVAISGSPTFGPGVGLYGGYDGSGVFGDIFTGNTLTVWNYSGSAVASVQNFENYAFFFPVTQSGPVLTVTGTAALTGVTGNVGNWESKSSKVTEVSTSGGTNPLQAGARVVLIDAKGTLNQTGFSQPTAEGTHGATLRYDWTLTTVDEPPDKCSASGHCLVARLDDVESRPGAKSVPEGNLGGLALIAQGADLVAGPGLAGAQDAVRAALLYAGGPPETVKSVQEPLRFAPAEDQRRTVRSIQEPLRFTPTEGANREDGPVVAAFSAFSGGSIRHDTGAIETLTGSSLDMTGVSLLTGVALGADAPAGRLTLGAFGEYGQGSYDSSLSFQGGSVHGSGRAWNLGGGVLGRLDFTGSDSGRAYTEASFRAGRLHNTYASGLYDGQGREAGFESSAPYYGAHLGLGHLWNVTEGSTLDLYGKYFWARVGADEVTLTTGEQVKFETVDSHRLRLGGRVTGTLNEHLRPYLGAAYEWEFDGRAKATVSGFDLDPTLFGGTGIGELGLMVRPSDTLPLFFDLGVQGYEGTRRGLTGSLRARFEF